jgi:hypothetical protein
VAAGTDESTRAVAAELRGSLSALAQSILDDLTSS